MNEKENTLLNDFAPPPIPECSDPVTATPFDDVIGPQPEEKKKRNTYGFFERLTDRLWVSSKAESRIAAGIFWGCFAVFFYLIFILFVRIAYAANPIKHAVDYSPLNFPKLLLDDGSPGLFITTLILSFLIGFGLSWAYLAQLERKENNGIIRSKLGVHGTANWINYEPGELKRTFERTDENGKPGYVIIGKYRGWTYSVCQDPKHYQVKNFNICGIGASGTGKTFGLFGPMILCRIVYRESFMATDTKGDLYRNFAHVCELFGYDVKVFNTTSWKNSDSWDCLEDIVLASEEEVQNYINIFTNTIMNNTVAQKEDFWGKQEAEMLRACLNLVIRDSSYEGRRTFAEVIQLINSKETEIREKMELADPKVKRAIQSVLAWDNAKVREDVRAGLSGRLSIYRTEVVAEAMSVKGINFKDAVNRPTAIFIVTKDSDSTYDAVTSLFVTSMYMKLVEISNARGYKGKLARPFWFIMDEMCNMAAIKDLDKKIATNRSRRINFCLCIQSKSQMDQKYPRLANNILSNCGIVTFLGSDDDDSVKYVTNRCGTFTQVEKQETKDVPIWKKVYIPIWRRETTKLSAKKLLEYDEASKFKSGQVVQLIQGKSPFKGSTYPQTEHYLWKYVEPMEPEDRHPAWYNDFCEKYPEYKDNEGIEYVPSRFEEEAYKGPVYEPPKKVTKDDTEDRIRSMLGAEKKPPVKVHSAEGDVRHRAIERAREKLREHEREGEERNVLIKVAAAETAVNSEELVKPPEEDPPITDTSHRDEANDYSDIEAHSANMMEADEIGGDHQEADFDPFNNEDDMIDELFL